MTEKILLSELRGVTREDFDLCVQTHARDLREHDEHHTRLALGAEDHVAYPAPSSLSLVDRAIRRPDFVVDYEIVDDTPRAPTAEELLAMSRSQRRSELRQMEEAAANAVVAPGKIRAFALREADLRNGLAELRLSEPEATLPKEDEDFLREQEARRAGLLAIHRHGAQLEAEIEDLDEEALKTWQPRPFPG